MAEARDEDFSGTRILWGSKNTSKFLEFQALFSSNSPISVPCNLFYSVEACNGNLVGIIFQYFVLVVSLTLTRLYLFCQITHYFFRNFWTTKFSDFSLVLPPLTSSISQSVSRIFWKSQISREKQNYMKRAF
jgi:hypothetical protein